MIVKPEPEDVEWAETQNRWACVVVRSIQRQIPSATFVRVDKETIAYSDRGHRYYHPTPPKMIEDIIKPFDEHKIEEVKLDEYPLIVSEIKPIIKLSTEKKVQLRKHDRIRSKKERNKVVDRTHDRFCPVEEDNGSDS
jgi:hypothetical protein